MTRNKKAAPAEGGSRTSTIARIAQVIAQRHPTDAMRPVGEHRRDRHIAANRILDNLVGVERVLIGRGMDARIAAHVCTEWYIAQLPSETDVLHQVLAYARTMAAYGVDGVDLLPSREARDEG